MILRPVRPASPTGPPMTKRPVGLTRKDVSSASASYRPSGSVGRTTCCHRSARILPSTPASCCVEMRTFSTATGLVVHVADGDLGLAVGAQVVERAVLADRGEALGEAVGQRDRERHELRRLVAGVAEHHALVARAGDVEVVGVAGHAVLEGVVDALGDVGRLLVDGVEDGAGVGGEAELGVRVADLADRLAGDLLDVDVDGRRDLTGHDHQPRVDEGLAGDAPVRVVAQHGVEDAVRDLVGHLVGVTLGDGLGSEEVVVHLEEEVQIQGRVVPLPAHDGAERADGRQVGTKRAVGRNGVQSGCISELQELA